MGRRLRGADVEGSGNGRLDAHDAPALDKDLCEALKKHLHRASESSMMEKLLRLTAVITDGNGCMRRQETARKEETSLSHDGGMPSAKG